MGSWSYKNIGADARPEHKKFVEKIFEYIGYTTEPANTGEGYAECTFWNPDVYGCVMSDYDEQSGYVKDCFRAFDETDLLCLLNALFPKTSVYVHTTEGNTVSDTWESHNRIYNADTMTLECKDSYTDYGGDGPNGYRSWKERFTLSAPKQEYVQSLIELSTADGNGELTALLLELSRKLMEGLVCFKDDDSDTRAIGEEYDVREEGEVGRYDFEEDDDEDDEDYHLEDDDDEYENNDDSCEGDFIIEGGVLKEYKGDFEHVIIPDGVTEIGYEAFSGCEKLSSITIPNSVTSIGEGAFSWCEGLSSIIIPSSVTSIGDSAFADCIALKKITIPNGVSSIGAQAFVGCTSLTSITIPNSVTSIEGETFLRCKSLSNISIPNSVTRIEYEAFSECESLTSIIIPNGVTCIEDGAFSGCESLTKIIIPDGVTCIGDYAFAGCTALKSIVLPNSVTQIGEKAFYYCSSLKKICLPKGVVNIGNDAFSDCNDPLEIEYI